MDNELDKTIHYYSQHITAKLQEMLRARTTVVEAPLGYGKTTAVRDYLDNHLPDGVPLYWFTAFDEEPYSSWRRLCGQIEQIDPQTGAALLSLGFPTRFTVGEVAEHIRQLCCPSSAVLVIDNLQLLQRELPDDVLLALLYHGGKELHLIVITQILEKNALAAFGGTGMHAITERDLSLAAKDIQSYYGRSGVEISERQAEDIERYTEGWIIAVYLQLLSYIEMGDFTTPVGIKTLIQQLVWDKLSAKEQRFLLSISIFENVTKPHACYLLGVDTLPEYVELLTIKVPLIRFMAEKGCYHIHSILSDLLRERFYDTEKSFQHECIARSADWYCKSGQAKEALFCLWRLRDYGQILSLNLDSLDITKICNTTMENFALELAEKASYDVKAKHMIAMLRIAITLYGEGRRDEYDALMKELSAIIEAIPGPEKRRRMLGEWTLVSSFADFPYIDRMGEKYMAAAQLLGGHSQVILPTDPYMFGCPSIWYLFHVEPGAADKTAEVLENVLHVYTAITGGNGSGADVLYRGELHCMRGQFVEAEVCAYKAAYIAESKNQLSIRFGAALLLGRIAISRCDNAGLDAAIDYLNQAATGEHSHQNCSFNHYGVDVVRGMLLSMLEEPSLCAQWIREGQLNKGMMEPGRLMIAHIFVTAVVARKEYAKALNIMAVGMQECERLHNMVAKIYIYIGQTLSYLALGDVGSAVESLRRGLDISVPDGILVIYVRFFKRMEAILDHPGLADYRDALQKIKHLDAHFIPQENPLFSGLLNLGGPQEQGLTEREYEVALLASKGNRNKEIARLLNVSENTVKTHLKSVFSKLSVDRRSKLIKRLT